MSISRTLGESAAPITLEHRGKVYHFRLVIEQMASEYERWLEGRARASLLALRDILPPEDFAAEARRYRDDIEAGKYCWGSPLCNETLNKSVGTVKLASLICDCTEAEAMRLLVERGDEVKLIVDQIQRESHPKS